MSYVTPALKAAKQFGINTLGTGAVTATLGQFKSMPVKQLQFAMPLQNVAVGSAFAAAAGTGAEKALSWAKPDYDTTAFKLAAYVAGTAVSALAMPYAASLVGMSVTSQAAMALGLASVAQRVLQIGLAYLASLVPAKKPAEAVSENQIKEMKAEDFHADFVASKKMEGNNDAAKKVAADRAEIIKTHDWNAALYAKHTTDADGFKIDDYKADTDAKAKAA